MSQQSLFRKSRSLSRIVMIIKRRLRLIEILPDRIFSFEIYSLTRAGYDIEHHMEADLESGALRCSCEDFIYRHARFAPTIGNPKHICKHLCRVLDYLVRNKHLHGREVAVQMLLNQLRPCCECGVDMAEYQLCDERGFALDGFMCCECVQRKRDAASRLEDLRCHRLDRDERWIKQGQRELEALQVMRQPVGKSSRPVAAWKPEREMLYQMLANDVAHLEAQHNRNLQQWSVEEGVSR